MLWSILILIIALAVLVKASDRVIDAAVDLARFIGVSEFTIGFLLIAVITSLPELTVSIFAAMNGSGNLAVANIIGSNIANIALVLGVAAVFGTLHFRRASIGENAEVLLIITIIPLLLLNSEFLNFRSGIILLITFLLYSAYLYKNGSTKKFAKVDVVSHYSPAESIVVLLVGLGLVLLSAHFVVSSAVDLAERIGVSDTFIGLTLIAFGTSVPELATTVFAVRKGKSALAVGNVIGSCVANLTLVLGLSAIAGVLTITLKEFSMSISFLVGITIFLWYILFKDKGINTLQGLFLITIYILFIVAEAGLLVYI